MPVDREVTITTNQAQPEEGQQTLGTPRRRAASKSFPVLKFEEVLLLPKGIVQHAAGDQIRRITLFDKLERSPDSGTSRQLVTGSGRYGLTAGSYSADYLSVTADGRTLVEGSRSDREVRQIAFQLAIRQFEVFESLYERLKNRRLPATDVLKDEVLEVGVSRGDSELASEIFSANFRYLQLIGEQSGVERIIPIEQVLEELSTDPARPGVSPASPPSSPPADPPMPAKPIIDSKEPSVHIDIQIHIDSSASPEQIDQIFSSMARHLYRRED